MQRLCSRLVPVYVALVEVVAPIYFNPILPARIFVLYQSRSRDPPTQWILKQGGLETSGWELFSDKLKKKSRIRLTTNLSTHADSSTDICFVHRRPKRGWKIFFLHNIIKNEISSSISLSVFFFIRKKRKKNPFLLSTDFFCLSLKKY